ncbi:sensor histidine kinase [Fodinibius halophilus]|uniref:histidine kinase n=1 Tax=Fodinibius halophilus TaxID=1736908 RepID=A0A6M1SVF2_9BACT|nr:GAF domain-containing sensor histidine kinase [Fodinibius halophilus]NGP87556.1 GAF domain-containing sensor histidine kinase [Fodinibius halophilus]
MNKELNQLPHPSSLVIEVGKQYLSLHPCIALAKHAMDSAACKINIIDSYYQHAVACTVDETAYKDNLCFDTIRQNGIYEVENLSNNSRYKDHSYVKDPPHFEYYCGTKLTTSDGADIGSICVLDPDEKRATDEQKEQLRQLALLVMNTIESEYRYNNAINKLDSWDDSFHKLNHDVRTPITGIVGLADLLNQEKESFKEPIQELTLIKESAETILEIIDDVLENLNTNSNGQEEREKNCFTNIIKQLQRLYIPPAKVKGLTFTFTNKVDTSLKISHSFSIKLMRATSNLVSNAIKFTPENGTVAVTITQETDMNNSNLNITVTDSGCNMTTEQVDAFNNDRPVPRSAGTNGERSFGVGLKYVKQMTTQAGGTTSVTVDREKGTQFSISLPVPVDETDKTISTFPKTIITPVKNGMTQ